MNSKRLFFILLAVILLLSAGVFGVFYKSKNMLSDEGESLVDLKVKKEVLEKQRKDLLQAQQDVLEYSELESITRSIVPQDKDQARTIAEIATHARNAGIALGNIVFPQSELGKVQANSKKKQSTPKDGKTTQLTEVEDIKGLYVMEINVTSHQEAPVLYDQLIAFLKNLENNRRTALVTDINISPNQKVPGKFNFDIMLNTYIRP